MSNFARIIARKLKRPHSGYDLGLLDAKSALPLATEVPFEYPTPPPGSPSPEMLPRPEGMTRQAHRRLFREACKIAGVDHRTAKKTT